MSRFKVTGFVYATGTHSSLMHVSFPPSALTMNADKAHTPYFTSLNCQFELFELSGTSQAPIMLTHQPGS